jgi:hypothetical protein
MGGAASRGAARATEAASHAPKPTPSPGRVQAQELLERLPEHSAVRKDAERAAQFEQWRILHEQHLDGVQLEEQNARDEGLTQLMHKTMQHPEGQIQYKEQYLPMQSSAMAERFELEVGAVHAPVYFVRQLWNARSAGTL